MVRWDQMDRDLIAIRKFFQKIINLHDAKIVQYLLGLKRHVKLTGKHEEEPPYGQRQNCLAYCGSPLCRTVEE